MVFIDIILFVEFTVSLEASNKVNIVLPFYKAHVMLPFYSPFNQGLFVGLWSAHTLRKIPICLLYTSDAADE